ncbi:hypothetical protein T265_06703 [Opisthorchis viverrini]|uniref:Uncharacterized protein n=1 Tax=Opisthorchis viverrini TaxID=6198 RepID=A0A074ZJI7_OPIVI|nr:hypothetical protein T265_06703 [Opisthorchis viverrini]KER25952.1 hypothetical protein T265_06703 [Opisthorchis viverrini]
MRISRTQDHHRRNGNSPRQRILRPVGDILTFIPKNGNATYLPHPFYSASTGEIHTNGISAGQ